MADNYLPGFDIQKQLDTLPQKNIEGQIEKILAKASEIERAIFKLSFFEHKNDTEIAILVFNDKKKRTSVCKQKEEIRYFVACHLKRLLDRD